jgi:hypothetical protein
MKVLNTRTVEICEAKIQGFQLSDYQTRDLQEKRQDLAKFANFAELVEVVSFSIQNEKYYFEHVNILIKFKGILLTPAKPYNENMYRFFLLNSIFVREFKTVSIEPKRVGVPNEKKLNDWLQYLLECESEKLREEKIREEKKQAFILKIEASGQKIVWNLKKTGGYINNEVIDYQFTICDNGYISEKITIRKNDLNSFLTLIK